MAEGDVASIKSIAQLCDSYVQDGDLDILGSEGLVRIADNEAFRNIYTNEARYAKKGRERVQCADGKNRVREYFSHRGWTFETYISEQVTRVRRR